MAKVNVCPLLVALLAGSPASWIGRGVFTVYDCAAEKAIGLRLSRSVLAEEFWATVTWNDCVVFVLVAGSVVVTEMVDVSPARAWVTSMWITPLGFVSDRVAVLMRIGLIGCVFAGGVLLSFCVAT